MVKYLGFDNDMPIVLKKPRRLPNVIVCWLCALWHMWPENKHFGSGVGHLFLHKYKVADCNFTFPGAATQNSGFPHSGKRKPIASKDLRQDHSRRNKISQHLPLSYCPGRCFSSAGVKSKQSPWKPISGIQTSLATGKTLSCTGLQHR